MAKQNNDYNKIKGLWNESLDKVNNTINVSSTSISDPGLKKHIDFIRNNSQADWHPEEGYDALQEKLKVAEYNNAKFKANQQGFFGEAGGFLAQAVVGEIALGTLEGVGYLLDVPGWFDSLSGTEKEYGNWFSDLMKEGQEGLAELAPIYQDPDNQNRSMWQNMIHGDGWWAQNGVSIASAASLLIPVTGWARFLGMVGKGLSMLNTAGKLGKLGKYGALATKPIDIIETFAKATGATSKTGKFITGGLNKAFVSRHLENTMEAGQVFDEKYQQYIEQGFSEEEAKKYAGEGAAFTYNMGWAMMLQDIPQYMLLGIKGFNISKAVTGAKMAKLANSSVKKAVALNVGRKSFDFLSEGAEEAYQFIVAEEGKYLADVQAGLVKPDENFQERLKKYSEDSELWTSAFFGGLGGNLFNAVAGGVEKRILNKRTGALTEEQERLQELLTWKERTSQSLRDFYEAQDLDDEKAAEVAKTKMTFNMGVEAASVGNWAIRKQQFMDMKNATPEELEKEFNIPKESVSEFVANIDEHIKNAEKAAKMFAVNMNKFDSSIAYQATYLQYMSEHFTNKIPELNKKIDDLIQQIPNVNTLTPQGKQAFDQKLAVLAAERLIKSNENIINKVKHLSEEDKQHYITKNEELKEIIKEGNIKIEEAKRLKLDANDRIAMGHLTGGFADDIVRASIEKEYANFYSNKWLSDLDQLTNSDNLKNIKSKIESEQEELINKEIKKDNNQKVTKSNEAASGMTTSNKPDDIGTPMPEEVTSTETDMEGFHDLVTSGALDINTVDPDIKLEYEKWLSDKESQKQFAKHNVNTIKDIGETPSNPDIEEFTKGSDNTDTVTQLNTPLAYLSYNNSRATEEDKTEANKALSDFLENGDSIIGVSVRFEIDYDYLNNNKGRKHYKEIQSALTNKKTLTRDQLGVVPIKAVLYRDGELLLHNDQKLTMYLHEDDFFVSKGSENAVFQTEKLLQTRSIILDGLTKDQIVESELINKTRGKINIDTLNYDGSYKQNSYLEVLNKSPENVTLIYGDDLGNYLKHDKSVVKELALLTSSSKGAIYAMSNTANGQPFPLRLQTAKIKPSEAELVYTLYSSIISQPKLFKQAVSTKLDNGESLADAINNSTDPIIAGLSQYLDLDKITYSDLLSHIIYEGKNTMSSNESRLLIKLGEEVNGVKTPSTLVYGNNNVTAAELLKPESKDAFIEHLVKNRNRQVDIKYLNNNQYKNYLDVNKILSTNVKPSNGVIFVQPVIEYSDNIQISNNKAVTTTQTNSQEVSSKAAEIERRRQEELDKDENQPFDFYPRIDLREADTETKNKFYENERKNKEQSEKRDKINAKYDAELKALEQQPTSTTQPDIEAKKADIERRRREDLQKGQLFLMNDGTYGGSRLVSLEEYSTIQIQENDLDSDVTKWDYNTFNDTGIFVNLSLGVAYIVPNNSYNGKKAEVVKVFINKTTKRFDLSNPRIINTPNIELVAKAANIDSKELYNEVLNAITKYDAELAALAQQDVVYSNTIKKKNEISSINEPDEFQGAVDMTALLENALKNQTPTDEFLSNLPDVDDEIPLFKLMIPSDNTINIEEEVSLITKLLPKDISIKLYDSYVQVLNNGAVAAGMFKNNMISLSKLAPIGTAYHEAFHAIFRTMLSSTERGILINDIKKIAPIPSEAEITDIMVNNKTSKIDAINIYYEELLANEFAEYMQSKGININKRLSNPIIKFFNTILEWISNVFTSNTITANKLFDNIAKGKYGNNTNNAEDSLSLSQEVMDKIKKCNF